MLLNKIRIHESTLIQINIYINWRELKTLSYNRMPTNQYGMNDESVKSPFDNQHRNNWFREESSVYQLKIMGQCLLRNKIFTFLKVVLWDTGVGRSRFTIVYMEKIIINNNIRINSVFCVHMTVSLLFPTSVIWFIVRKTYLVSGTRAPKAPEIS